MEEIRKFLLNLPVKDNAKYNYDEKVVNLSITQNRPNSNKAVLISSYNTAFFKHVLIPFFDSMVWQSKKKLDYPPPLGGGGWSTPFGGRLWGLKNSVKA